MELLRIKDLLKEKGITSKEFSERLEVTPATVSNIANGNHFPKPELLRKIAEELEVDIRDLFISTKEDKKIESIYIEREGKFIKIGMLDLNDGHTY